MLILEILVFAIPITLAAILHMVAVRFNLFASLKIPLDYGKTYKGKRIFGDSKTYRGVVLMMLLSILGVYILQLLCSIFEDVNSLNIMRFNQYPGFFYGTLFGLGYTLAELPNSFFKRRKGIPEGKSGSVLNIILDQFDSVVGCMLLLFPFTNMSWSFFGYGCLVFLGLHMFFNLSLYLIGVRKNPTNKKQHPLESGSNFKQIQEIKTTFGKN